MAVKFNPLTGMTPDDGQTIRSRLAQLWKKALQSKDSPELNTEPETPAGQLIDGQAALVIAKDNEVLHLANMINPATSDGIFQDALGRIYFLTRHVAESTLVTCTCRGLNGTIIPYGAIVQDVNGNQYYNTTIAEIDETGAVNAVFRCSQRGPIVVEAQQVNKIITVIPGWDSVSNTGAGVTGRDREGQQEFEIRRARSVAKNSHGLAESVEGSVGNLSGVIACRIEQNRGHNPVEKYGVTIPGHSVYLSVYGGDKEEIARTMHKKLDAGCGTAGNTKVEIKDPTNGTPQIYYYEIPEAVGMSLKITIQPDSDTPPNIADLIKQAIIKDFAGEGNSVRIKMGEQVFASRFYPIIEKAGTDNILSVEIAYPAGSAYRDMVQIPLDAIPTITEDDITIIEQGAE